MRSKWSKRIFVGMIALYFVAVVVYVGLHSDQFQWDFKAYYYAGHAYEKGLNPYLHASVAEVAGEELGYFYAYSPATLPLLRVLTLVDFQTAYFLYLFCKLLALGGLLYLWTVKFMSSEVDPIFYLFCLFGFGGAIYIDLISGNISLFEQLGLWIAFYAFLINRRLVFCFFIVLASLFKLTPIIFLVLLLFKEERDRFRYLILSGAGFIVIQGLSYLQQPIFFEHFLSIGWKLDERGFRNPSMLALLRDGFEFLEQRNLYTSSILPFFIYLAFSVVIVLITWFVMKRVKKNNRLVIFMICLAYALIMPRIKDYSYVLLLLPTYWLVKNVIRVPTFQLWIILLMLSRNLPVPFGLSEPISALIWGYYSLLVIFVIWALASSAIYKNATSQDHFAKVH
jgi:hypothetical protein